MKIPFQGEMKLSPLMMPDSARLNESVPCLIPLHSPYRQGDVEFKFLVVMTNWNSEGQLEPYIKGVACQTEEEAKESMEFLNLQSKTAIGLMQWAGGGTVVTVKNLRHFCHTITVGSIRTEHDKKVWLALEREIDKATGEITVIRRKEAANEQEALSIANGWLTVAFAVGAARLVSTPSLAGLARDCHFTGFPEFEQFCILGFPQEHSII